MNRSLRRSLVLLVALVLGLLATLAPGGTAVAAGGKPAPVKITLKPNVTGKVTSDRAGCVKQRYVYLLGRTTTGEIGFGGVALTDDQGRYPSDSARRGDVLEELFSVVLGDDRCRVAQSRTISPPTRSGGLAKRKITLQIGTASLSGRVTSKRAGCVKHVPVLLFLRNSAMAPWSPVAQATTNKQGKYSYGDARLPHARGDSAQVLALAVGDDACSVAQSPNRSLG